MSFARLAMALVLAASLVTGAAAAPPHAAGKWPEGVAVSGGAAWVAQSGERTVARIDPATGEVGVRVKVGRLPTAMAAGPDGTVYVLVNTDQKVLALDPAKKKARTLTKLPDCPQAMALGDGALYVLLWKQCSSVESSVVRVDLRTKKVTRSAATGPNAFNLAVDGGRVFVIRDHGLVRLDAATLQATSMALEGDRRTLVAAGAGAVFTDAHDAVVRLDPETGTETARQSVGERVAVLAFLGGEVVAVGIHGNIWRLDPVTLAPFGTARLEGLTGEPRSVTRDGDRLLVTSFDASMGASDTPGQLHVVPLAPAP